MESKPRIAVPVRRQACIPVSPGPIIILPEATIDAAFADHDALI